MINAHGITQAPLIGESRMVSGVKYFDSILKGTGIETKWNIKIVRDGILRFHLKSRPAQFGEWNIKRAVYEYLNDTLSAESFHLSETDLFCRSYNTLDGEEQWTVRMYLLNHVIRSDETETTRMARFLYFIKHPEQMYKLARVQVDPSCNAPSYLLKVFRIVGLDQTENNYSFCSQLVSNYFKWFSHQTLLCPAPFETRETEEFEATYNSLTKEQQQYIHQHLVTHLLNSTKPANDRVNTLLSIVQNTRQFLKSMQPQSQTGELNAQPIEALATPAKRKMVQIDSGSDSDSDSDSDPDPDSDSDIDYDSLDTITRISCVAFTVAFKRTVRISPRSLNLCLKTFVDDQASVSKPRNLKRSRRKIA